MAIGFAERQARFLVNGASSLNGSIGHLPASPTARRHTTFSPSSSRAATPHRSLRARSTVGRLFSCPVPPLYEAIGETNNRHRKSASRGRFVERLMLPDAVLADKHYGWLGTEHDKLTYFLDTSRPRRVGAPL